MLVIEKLVGRGEEYCDWCGNRLSHGDYAYVNTDISQLTCSMICAINCKSGFESDMRLFSEMPEDF